MWFSKCLPILTLYNSKLRCLGDRTRDLSVNPSISCCSSTTTACKKNLRSDSKRSRRVEHFLKKFTSRRKKKLIEWYRVYGQSTTFTACAWLLCWPLNTWVLRVTGKKLRNWYKCHNLILVLIESDRPVTVSILFG